MRNNQRRSREKRKEYIAELEAKIQQYETTTGSHSISCTAIEGLRKDVETLKRLLDSLGLGDEFIKAYMKASQIAPATSKSIGLLDSDTKYRRTTKSDAISHEQTEQIQPSDTLPECSPFDFTKYFDDLDNSILLDSVATPLTQPIAAPTESARALTGDFKYPIEQEDTTLCSVAFTMVMTINRKGYNAEELDLKLRAGYSNGQTIFEGCRFNNKILLDVLAEIM